MLVAFLTFGAAAQEKGNHRQHKGKGHHEMVSKELNLTDAQKEKIKTINKDHHSQRAELRKNENITVKEMRERRSAIAKEHRSAIEGVYTPEQKTKLQELRKKSAEQRKETMAKRGEKMKEQLSLTSDQSSKLKTMNDSYREKFEAIRKDESLDQSAKKQQFQTLRQQKKEEMKAILNADQLQKLEEMKKDRGRKFTR